MSSRSRHQRGSGNAKTNRGNISSSNHSLNPPDRPTSPTAPRRQPRIQVASLLTNPHARFYQLDVIQHPIKTAAFENSLLSRLPVSPPLIVRLTVRDTSGNALLPDDELPFLIAHLSLMDEQGIQQVDRGSAPGHGPVSQTLYGNLVAVVEQPFEDLQGNLGLFYLFPDVSVRWRGRFQFRVSLARISTSVDSFTGAVSLGRQGVVLAEARSSVFDVVSAAEYTAIAQTRLTQSFIRQGAWMFPFS